MSNKDILIELLPQELSDQPSVERRLIISVIEAANKILPKDLLTEPFNYFISASSSDESQTIEFALLTADNLIHDLTFTLTTHTICTLKLTKDVFIILRSFYRTDPSSLSDNKLAYRSDLRIIKSDSSLLSYSAEGKKKIVEKLIQFGRELKLAQHSLKE